MDMRGDSCSNGCEFESRHRILDGHFFTYLFVAKFVMCFLKKTQINEKEAGVGPFLFKTISSLLNCQTSKWILILRTTPPRMNQRNVAVKFISL